MISLHSNQTKVFKAIQEQRYVVACTSRGFGKSFLGAAVAVTKAFELMQLDDSVPNKNVYIVCPTYDQTLDIYLPVLVNDFQIEQYTLAIVKDRGKLIFPKNVEIRLISYEAIERMRGKGSYFVLWDEVSSCNRHAKEMWEGVIQPTITTRWSEKHAERYKSKPGGALFLSTPRGYNFFYDLYLRYPSYRFDYKQSPLLDPKEIEMLQQDLHPVEFASEYLAEFRESGNSVFYCFNRDKHVVNVDDFHVNETIYACIDFNVGVQATSLVAIRGDEAHVIDEMHGSPDTEALAKRLKTYAKGRKIYAHPDPTGKARKTSAPVGRTDFSILEEHGIPCLSPRGSPPIVDSVAVVNRKLHQDKLLIHPRCKRVIQSLERTKWADSHNAVIDKSEGVEHFSDNIRYGMHWHFPLLSKAHAKRGFGF